MISTIINYIVEEGIVIGLLLPCTGCFRPVTLWAPTCSTAFKIAVSSSLTAGVFLDKSPRFFDAKGAAMPGLMFMSKEGKSDAPMLKIKKNYGGGKKSAGRDNFCSSTRRDT
jgi:hypothetical protein